jgi:hypothetical protein
VYVVNNCWGTLREWTQNGGVGALPEVATGEDLGVTWEGHCRIGVAGVIRWTKQAMMPLEPMPKLQEQIHRAMITRMSTHLDRDHAYVQRQIGNRAVETFLPS